MFGRTAGLDAQRDSRSASLVAYRDVREVGLVAHNLSAGLLSGCMM